MELFLVVLQSDEAVTFGSTIQPIIYFKISCNFLVILFDTINNIIIDFFIVFSDGIMEVFNIIVLLSPIMVSSLIC